MDNIKQAHSIEIVGNDIFLDGIPLKFVKEVSINYKLNEHGSDEEVVITFMNVKSLKITGNIG